MRHRLGGIPTYGLSGLGKGDEHPVYTPLEYYDIFTFTFNGQEVDLENVTSHIV